MNLLLRCVQRKADLEQAHFTSVLWMPYFWAWPRFNCHVSVWGGGGKPFLGSFSLHKIQDQQLYFLLPFVLFIVATKHTCSQTVHDIESDKILYKSLERRNDCFYCLVDRLKGGAPGWEAAPDRRVQHLGARFLVQGLRSIIQKCPTTADP